MSTTTAGLDLHTPYPLTPEQIAQFRRDGFIKLKQVLSPEVIDYYGSIITSEVHRLNTMHLPIEQREALAIFTADERTATVNASYGAPAPAADIFRKSRRVSASLSRNSMTLLFEPLLFEFMISSPVFAPGGAD